MSYRRYPDKLSDTLRWLGWVWLVVAFLIGAVVYRLFFW